MRGSIRKRGNKWCFITDVPTPDGTRKQKWFSGFATRREAEAASARIISEIDGGAFVEPSAIKVGEFLTYWLAAYAATNVAAKTLQTYTEIVERSLIPALGHVRLCKLSPAQIQGFYSQQLTSGRKAGGGLSARTVHHIHTVLHESLKHAVKWQMLSRNPSDAVDPPRPLRTEVVVLDAEQSRQLLAAAEGTEHYIPVLLGLSTGMRRGEIFALRWSDVDLERSLLTVNRSLEQTHAGLSFKSPKTAKSRRQIALPAECAARLKSCKTKQAGARLLLGEAYQNNDLVCCRGDGSPIKPDSFSVAFKAFATRIGMPGLSFHKLRHTHATALLRANIHPKIVSERLGHSTVGITLDTYSHCLPGMQVEAAASIDAALFA